MDEFQIIKKEMYVSTACSLKRIRLLDSLNSFISVKCDDA